MSQFARVAAAILAGFVALALIVQLVFMHDQMLIGARAFVGSLVDRTLALHTLLDGADAAERRRLITASSGPDFRVSIQHKPAPVAASHWPHADELIDVVQRRTEAAGPATDLRLDFPNLPGRRHGAVRLVMPLTQPDYLVVTADAQALTSARPAGWGILMTLAVVALVLWMVKRSTRHLPQFAAAAESLGRDINTAAPLPVTGPSEVRRAALAFNDMAQRVRKSLNERTEMLAAVSHDLRTLLTRLALRLEQIDAATDRERARADVARMTELIDSVLAFAREDKASEPRVRLDLATLLITLCDDERGLGRHVCYHGPDHHVILGRSSALRRALSNLLDNAIRYGNRAQVTLFSEPGQATIEIADTGPGIPEAERARMLLPFQRLERSRNRDTGGTGLGLAIANAVIVRHPGTLTLLDRPGGGLLVRITLES